MLKQELVICTTCCAVIFLLIILILGWDVVETTFWGLKCNSYSKRCEQTVYSPGRYLVGPFNFFFNFPGSLQTLEFSDSKNAKSLALRTRSAEGLALYRLIKEEIPKLYEMNGLFYEQTFIRMARDTILQAAGNFQAAQYWTERQKINQVMKIQLQEELKKAHAYCVYIQILQVQLPALNENCIVQTQIEIQKKVIKQFDQQIKQIEAQAQADSFTIVQKAIAQSDKLLIEAETMAYQEARNNLNLTTSKELNDFLFWSQILKQNKVKQSKNSILVICCHIQFLLIIFPKYILYYFDLFFPIFHKLLNYL